MRTTVPLKVTPAARKQLEALLTKRTRAHRHARRIRVVLLAADGVPGVEIARRVSISHFQVSRIRKRFERAGVKGLEEQPRPGRGTVSRRRPFNRSSPK